MTKRNPASVEDRVHCGDCRRNHIVKRCELRRNGWNVLVRCNGTERAIYGLLGRFDIAIENSKKDANEKAFVFEL